MSAGLGVFGQTVSALFLPTGRSIGPYVPHVVIEEQHRDDLVITEFPVEIGAAITDHSYKRPSTVVIRAGWSDSTTGLSGSVKQIYQQLLALQASRQPFAVSTGKRMYQDMLFNTLDVGTDATSEYALIIIASLKQIILTSTQSSSPNTAQPAQNGSDQANPQSTGSVADRGVVQTQAVTDQDFAGAYNPGSTTPVGPGAYNVDGTPAVGQGFGLNTPGADIPLAQNPNLSGISPPTEITLPELTVTSPEMIGGLQSAGPDQYSMFGGGP